MLLQFRFSNFRCFADETIFDMTATSIKEHKYSLYERNGSYVLPVAAIYGANASGKSSFFMAFEKMRNIVVNNTGDERTAQPTVPFVNPFIFDSSHFSEPASYEVCVLIEDHEYRYGFECTNQKVLNEYLYKRKFSKNKTKEKIIFERNELNVSVGTINQAFKNEIEYCASMLTEKSLLLPDIGEREKIIEIAMLYLWFKSSEVVSLSNRLGNVPLPQIENFIGYFLEHNINVSTRIKNMIRELDPCVVDVLHFSDDVEGTVEYKLKTKHSSKGVTYEVPLSIESDGTKRLLFLAFFIIFTLDMGTTCLIDEMDMSLHPLMLRKIVQMFTNKEINKNHAQLIFSAHNIINLDSSDLRRDEIWFVEKKDHKSYMYSLCDFEDNEGSVRSDLSYGKHYLSGRFGAVPFQED